MSFIPKALLVVAVGTNFLSYTLAVPASCKAGWEWANNTLEQNPCEVAGRLEAACQGFSVYDLGPLSQGTNYVAPQKNASANICDCNTVMYSLYMACTSCQNVTQQSWTFWAQNCGEVYVTQYPNDIPLGTAVPHWAYLDVSVGSGSFDPVAAKAAGDSPEALPHTPSIASLPPSSTPPSSSNTGSATDSGSSSSSSPSGSGSPNSDGSNNGSTTKKSSNTGAIAGGVVGGVAGLAIIGGLVFWFLRRRRNQSAAAPGFNEDRPYSDYASPYSGEPSMSQAPLKVYDPADPSTFPTQGHVPSLSMNSGQPTTYTTDHSFTRPAPGHYTGAPEL